MAALPGGAIFWLLVRIVMPLLTMSISLDLADAKSSLLIVSADKMEARMEACDASSFCTAMLEFIPSTSFCTEEEQSARVESGWRGIAKRGEVRRERVRMLTKDFILVDGLWLDEPIRLKGIENELKIQSDD